MKFHARHGVLPQERAVGNDFTVDLEYAYADIENAMRSDDINDAVSYADVYQVVKEEMGKSSQLIEHLAARISRSLQSHFPDMAYIKIKVSKLHPPIEGEVHSASVIIETS